jgi:hypothetical protein
MQTRRGGDKENNTVSQSPGFLLVSRSASLPRISALFAKRTA